MITASDEAGLLQRAQACLDGKSRSYVDDAKTLAKAVVELVEDRRLLNENLTSVQKRCTDLLNEIRADRAAALDP